MKFPPEIELLLGSARTPLDDRSRDRLRDLLRLPFDADRLLREARLHGLLPLVYRHVHAEHAAVAARRPEVQAIRLENLRLSSELLALHRDLQLARITMLTFK